MADQLIQVLTFTDVGAGQQAVLTHNLNIGGVAVKPDIVQQDSANFTITSVTATTVTVTNTSEDTATLNVWLERKHSTARAFGNVATTALSPQPFVPAVGGGGGGGGGGGNVGPGTVGTVAKFTASDTVEDSSISEAAGVTTIAAVVGFSGGGGRAFVENNGTLLSIYSNEAGPGGEIRAVTDAFAVRNPADGISLYTDVSSEANTVSLLAVNGILLKLNTDSVTVGNGISGVGFNGAAPVIRPQITGSRGGNAALASLLTALDAMGLITDNTVA